MKKIFCVFEVFVLIFTFCCCGQSMETLNSGGMLKVHFLKLKDGRCTLFEFPDGECMLSDSGTSDDFPQIYEYVRVLGIKTIDYVAVTYTDSFHMGGAVKIMQNFDVKALYVPEYAADLALYKNTVAEAAKRNCAVKILCCGAALKNENTICVSAVSPIENDYLNECDFAVSLVVSYGKNTFFIEGDCGTEAENDMVKSFGEYVKADVLAISCSGIDGVPSSVFLQKISPKYVVAQIINNNKPSKSVAESSEVFGAELLRTDINGNTVFKCDGSEITVNTDA